MHHEILLCLSGCPGNVFTTSRETGLFELVPDLPFVHPSEVSLVNRICRLGSHYSNLRQFIHDHTFSISLASMSDSTGLYVKAMAHGIDLVLDSYRKLLVSVEKQCIDDPQLSLSHLQSEFEEYQLLLPSLDKSINHVITKKLHGCQILSFLYSRCSCGVPHVREAYERVLLTCHGVLYKQLSGWMLYGLLQDAHKEFFVEPVVPPPVAATPSPKRPSPEKGGHTQEKHLSSASMMTSAHKINASLVPYYIPIRVVVKILFIGEAVQIFSGKEKEELSVHVVDSSTRSAASKLKADQYRFVALLSELQQQPVFDPRAFESCINQIRDAVAEHLWNLLVEEADLVGSLQTMKDFFLLGRGELFLTFIDVASSFMSLPPSAHTQRDVNVAFRLAMTKMGYENEELLKQFQFTLPPVPEKKSISASHLHSHPPQSGRVMSGWSQLGLSYTPLWPLHILFTPAVLEKYNAVFRVLLAVRRAQVLLQQAWHVQMSSKLRTLGPLWQLRIHMSFLIDNLQYYVQVDVLETQFSQLLERVKNTHDFESITFAHEQFLATLQVQLFISMPKVSHSLQEILDLCHQYHSLVQHMGSQLSDREQTLLNKIAMEFERQSSLFFRILSSVKSDRAAPHLAQLLLRVDYNKFFSSVRPLVDFSGATSSSIPKTLVQAPPVAVTQQ